MARKRTEFAPEVDKQIRALLVRGGTTDSILAALSGVLHVSRPTLARRIREIREGQRTGPPTPPPASGGQLPTTPDEIPEGTPLETFDYWIGRAKAMARQAEADKNIREWTTMTRTVVMLLKERTRATPPPVPDPNDSPDMKALAEDVLKRMHNLVDHVTEE